jgi:hypothetical protein
MQIKIHVESPPRSGSIPQPNGNALGKEKQNGWFPNPEGLHVYRKQLDDGTCDPGRGHT